MPNLPPVTIPPDALEKAEAKGVDHYENLTDEQRSEEGLPTRAQEAKPEEKPEAEPKPKPDEEKVEAKPAESDEEEEDAEDEEPGEDLTLKLFEEVAALRNDLRERGLPDDDDATKEEPDPLLSAALEHDDPVVRGLAERLQKAEGGLAKVLAEADEAIVERQRMKDDADFKAVQDAYTIDGKPLTRAQVNAVERYIVDNPEVGTRLSIEQITRVVHPDAVKTVRHAPPAKGPGTSANGNEPPVATIIDEGSSGGASAEPFKPRPNETIESAVAAFAKSQGWSR